MRTTLKQSPTQWTAAWLLLGAAAVPDAEPATLPAQEPEAAPAENAASDRASEPGRGTSPDGDHRRDGAGLASVVARSGTRSAVKRS